MAATGVVVNGATGKMGAETVAAVSRQADMVLAGGACRRDRGPVHEDANRRRSPPLG